MAQTKDEAQKQPQKKKAQAKSKPKQLEKRRGGPEAVLATKFELVEESDKAVVFKVDEDTVITSRI